MEQIKIPVGGSDFSEYRNQNYYYVDKSGLIRELLKTMATKVLLITRPRRFGKTLNMSMLSYFFDIRKDSAALFQGLEISENDELCRQWMNQYPTIFITFKTVDGQSYKEAYEMLTAVISALCIEHYYLLESEKINPIQKAVFQKLARKEASLEEVKNSLILITQMLSVYYNKSVILLIDEYDVPLAKASAKGFLDDMLNVVKGLLQVMKDNTCLQYAVVTGCLRIAKESIFAGIFAGAGYQVESNKKHGEGRSDIIVKDYAGDRIAVFEAKRSKNPEYLQEDCEKALNQIDEQMYAEEYLDDYKHVSAME